MLQQSSHEWHESQNDYAPFVQYLLGIVLAAYREFGTRMQLLTTPKATKADCVRETIRNHLGTITKAEIMELCPDISEVTVERTLSDLKAAGDIVKIGGGRYTKYTWNHEKE